MTRISLLITALLLGACGGSEITEKSSLVDDFSGLQNMKAEDFGGNMRLVGNLHNRETTSPIKYTAHTLYLAYAFQAQPGNRLNIWVKAKSGDPVAWVLDNNFNVLTENDDAEDAVEPTLDAHIVFTLPEDSSTTYYLIFRDTNLQEAEFIVSLKGALLTTAIDREDFDQLPSEEKLKVLYPDYGSQPHYENYLPSSDFVLVEVDTDDLRGEVKDRAESVIDQITDQAQDDGGQMDGIYAFTRDDQVYAYSIETSGRSYGNWGDTHVYDRNFEALTLFGWSD